jgi:hypothetical protein
LITRNLSCDNRLARVFSRKERGEKRALTKFGREAPEDDFVGTVLGRRISVGRIEMQTVHLST